jgi:hypothetical protein
MSLPFGWLGVVGLEFPMWIKRSWLTRSSRIHLSRIFSFGRVAPNRQFIQFSLVD